MNKSLKYTSFQILQFIFFVSIFLIPLVIMFFHTPKAPLEGHDNFILYGRTFLNPEHGRYIATWFGHFLIEHLPVLLNIHVSDLNVTVILGIKILINAIIFSLVSFGFLLFFDKKSKGDVWIWLLGYLASFFILFYSHFFFRSFVETTAFLEYVAGLIPYLIFLSSVFYFFTKEKIPTKPFFILILLATFFSGITVELLNVPSFIFISLITLFVLIDYLKSDKTDVLKKQRLNFFLFVLFVHLFSVILYYFQPTDHHFHDNHIFFSQWKTHLILIWNFFVKVKFIPFYIVNIIGLILIFLLKSGEKKENIRFCSSVLLINFCFLFYYFVVLYLIILFVSEINHTYIFAFEKIFFPYIVLLFNNFLTFGYLISLYSSLSSRKFYLLKISAIVFIVLSSLTFVEIEYYRGIRDYMPVYRQKFYRVEKEIIKQRGQETIIIPVKDFQDSFLEITNSYYSTLVMLYYPDFENVKTVITDESLEPEELTDEEKENLRFSNLLPHKINKFEGDYGILWSFKKEKEEGSRVYFKKMK